MKPVRPGVLISLILQGAACSLGASWGLKSIAVLLFFSILALFIQQVEGA